MKRRGVVWLERAQLGLAVVAFAAIGARALVRQSELRATLAAGAVVALASSYAAFGVRLRVGAAGLRPTRGPAACACSALRCGCPSGSPRDRA